MLKVYYQTLGCRSNYSDTVDIQAFSREQGTVQVGEIKNADVLVLNSCSVTDCAEREALKVLRKSKAENPEVRVIVTGCMAESSRSKLLASGWVDTVIGTGRHREVSDAILKGQAGREQVVQLPTVGSRKQARARRTISLSEELPSGILGPGANVNEAVVVGDELASEERSRARFHLRIQEGCENHCTFCVIPFTRGGLSSKPPQLVLNDLERLAELGYEEVVLTGTHLGGYGLDCGSSLLYLLEMVESLGAVKQVRLSSLDPNDVSLDLVRLIASSKRLCQHLHLCMQSFSDSVLKKMCRGYSLEEICVLVAKIKDLMPQCSIGTDVIVGFPGETREEFEQALDLYRELPFSYAHVFPYSEREGTAAVLLERSISLEQRRARAREWRDVDAEKRRQFRQRFIDEKLQVVREYCDLQYGYGTSNQYLPVKIPFAESSCKFQGWSSGKIGEFRVRDYDNGDGRLICE